MLQTAMIFGDNMVLQRQKEIPVWGTAEAGSEVCVTLGDASVCARVDKEGNWKAVLPPAEAAREQEMSICCGEEKLVYQNVCIGEVWLAGGQSNMEYPLGFDAEGDEMVETVRNRDLRFFDYPEASYEGALEDYNFDEFGFWRQCTKEDLPYFSAVGFYFSQKLSEELDVPIGIVGCNWGGTTACSWMDPSYLEDNAGNVWLKDYEKAIEGLDVEAYKAGFTGNPMNDRTKIVTDPMNVKLVKIGLTREEQVKMAEMMGSGDGAGFQIVIGPYYERRPGGLYETMLKKLVPYAIRGVIWYQGESDADHPEEYQVVFRRMIENWRDLWKEELPFLFVQLAPFKEWLAVNGLDYPIVRECQERVSKEVPNTWMASIGDSGMMWDIHPKKKRPVGERLGLLALGHVYGQDILCDAPEIEKAEGSEAGVVLHFAHGEGLYMTGDTCSALEVFDTEGHPLPIKSLTIDGNRLVVCVEGTASGVRFAQTDYYDINIYNQAGIPVKPFPMVQIR